MKRILMMTAVLALAAGGAQAEVRLAKVFTSHMVLQREAPVPVWGWADSGAKVTVAFAGQKAEAVADAAGAWQVQLPAMNASGEGRTLVVTSGTNTVRLGNVVVGDVWLCSGQSNMAFKTGPTRDEASLHVAHFPRIRFMIVSKEYAAQPAADLPPRQPGWMVMSTSTVTRCSAVAFYFGRRIHQEVGVPVGLLVSAVGGTRIESWTPAGALQALANEPRIARDRERDPGLKDPETPAQLYNGMIHPLIPFGLKGALWYQGEANGKEGAGYTAKKEAMIGAWRKGWGHAFPFYFVQLANLDRAELGEEGWARLREAQCKTLQVPHTGMAVTIDVGMAKDIHPTNKFDVGERLARWALAKDYGKKELVYAGPLYKSMEVDGARVRIAFEPFSVGAGLMVGKKDGLAPAAADAEGKLKYFAIAGADRKWVPAGAVIDGDTVVVSSPDVPNPVAVRYAFLMNPEGANLYNKEGLPASPFRTDDW